MCHKRLGFGLELLLFRLLEIGLSLLQIELLTAGIERGHDVAGVDELAGVSKEGDRQLRHPGSGHD